MNLFDSSVKDWIYDKLVSWGMSDGWATAVDGIIALLYLASIILVINFVLRWVLLHVAQWVVNHTKVTWDNILFDRRVLKHLCNIATPVIIMMMLPLIISALEIRPQWMISALHKVADI